MATADETRTSSDVWACFGSESEPEPEPEPEPNAGDDTGAGAGPPAPATRPSDAGVLSFHPGIEEAVLLHVERSVGGDATPARVVAAVDDFAWHRHWLMCVGDAKGELLDAEVARAVEAAAAAGRPCVAVEIGAYVGYSAVRIAAKLRRDAGDVLYSVEADPACVRWTRRMLELAGVQDMVHVLPGMPRGVLPVKDGDAVTQCHLLFIDHDKEAYLSDLRLCEDAGMLADGCVVVADNVLSFGTPISDYLDHVRAVDGPYTSSTLHESWVEYSVRRPSGGDAEAADGGDKVGSELVDGVEVSVYKGSAGK